MELVLLAKILKRKMKYQRMFLASGIGSLSGCMMLAFYSKNHTLMILLIEPVFVIMLMIAYQFSIEKAVKNSGYAWMIAVTSGGIFMILKKYCEDFWIINAILTIIITGCLYHEFGTGVLGKQQREFYQVEFWWNNKKVSVCAFLDTGNFLYEPISHLPVSILEEKTFKKYFHHSLEELIKKHQIDKIRMIPYHSVGKENGMMKGILVENLKIIEKEQRIEIPCAVVAVSKVSLSKWEPYEMLLHQDLIKNRRY